MASRIRFGARLATIAGLAAVMLATWGAGAFASNAVRISQVYGGGGASSGATYHYDYVELFNSSGSSVNIGGWHVEYGSATGNWGSLTTNYIAIPANTMIPACGYYLIQCGSSGTAGVNLPVTPDLTTTNMNVSATNGKMALFNALNSNLACGSEIAGTLVDKVAYGSANCAENTAVAVLSSTTGAVRNGGGMTDTDNNLNDFTVVTAPVPRNSSSTTNPACTGTTPIISATPSPATCYGTSTGSITATFSGGTGPYQVKLNLAGSYATQSSPYTFTGLAAGAYTVWVKDALNVEQSTGSIVVGQPLAITFTTASPLPTGAFGTSYSRTIAATGGTGTITYAVTDGALPAPLGLASNGTLSGTPTVSGPFSFTVTATDTKACTASQLYSLTISAPPTQYRSVASSDWNATATWESSTDGGSNWSPAASTPTSADGAITIRSPQTVTVTAGVAVDQVTVNSGATLATGATLTNNGTLTVNGALQLESGGSISGTEPTYGSNSTLIYAAPLTVGIEWVYGSTPGLGVPQNVTIQAGTGNTVTWSGVMLPIVPGNLTFTSGTFTPGNASFLVNGNIVGASGGTGWVNGMLQRFVSGAGTMTFDVGDAMNYTPVTLTFNSVGGSGGALAVSTVASTEPNLGTSTISATKNVRRYWNLWATGFTTLTYDATFNFAPTDVQNSANTSDFVVGKYSGSSWTYPTVGTRTSTSTQAKGLTSFSDFALGEPAPPPLVLSETHVDVACRGGSTGSIDLTVTGGRPGYTYLWSPGGATTQDLVNVAANTYKVVVTDAASQTDSISVTLTQPALLTFASWAYWPPTCNGSSDGYLALGSVQGGTPPYTYLWNTGATTPELSDITGGAYTVTITDSHGCTKTASYTLTQPAAVTVTAAPASPSVCTGGTTMVTVSGSGGTPPYSGGGSFPQGAGTVLYTVTDANSCTGTASVTVTVSTNIIVASAGLGGSILPDGTTTVDCGTGQTYTITPDPGYAIADVLVNGGSVGPVASYPITNVTANQTIHATFVQSSSLVSVGEPSGPILALTDHVSVPFGIVRGGATPPLMAFSVVFRVSAPLQLPSGKLSIHKGGFLPGDYHFQTIDKTGGAYQVDGTTLGSPCGTGSLGGTLFTIDLNATQSGTGTISIESVKLRDCDNVDIAPSMGTPLTVVADLTVTLTTVMAPAGRGSVALDPAPETGKYEKGTPVSLTAMPATGWHFVEWTGDLAGSTNPTSITMTGDKTVTATFAPDQHKLTINVTPADSGTVSQSPLPGLSGYDYGTTVSMTAMPAGGYHFVSWSGAAVGSTNPTTVLMDDDKTVIATFEANPAVGAISDLAATQMRTGNDPGSTTRIKLTWAATLPGTVVEVWRKGFGHYPEYDDAVGGAVPTASATYPPGEGWTLTAVTAPNGEDLVGERDFYYFVAFVKDDYGTWSPVSNLTAGTLNYHLGDVSDGYTPGTGNNLVDIADLSALGAAYGYSGAQVTAVGYLDVGPTSTGWVDGRPTTDNQIEFEDLVMFALNFGGVSAPQMGARPVTSAASGSDALMLERPELVAMGEPVTVSLRLQGSGTLLALSTKLAWDPAVVEPVSHVAGEWLTNQGGVAFSAKLGSVDAAVMRGQGMSGEGVLATVTFKVLSAGDPRIRIVSADGRNAGNEKVTVSRTEQLSAPKVPTVTTLAFAQPNPFRGSATMAFSLAQRGSVELAIYSVDGRRVRTLVSGAREPGEYRQVWDGRDDQGQQTGAGVYYARLVAGKVRMTRTVAYLR